MPIALPKDAEGGWLDPELTDPAAMIGFARDNSIMEFMLHPVNPRVNNAKNEGTESIQPFAWASPLRIRPIPSVEARRSMCVRLVGQTLIAPFLAVSLVSSSADEMRDSMPPSPQKRQTLNGG
jgi:hypothetical protein